MSKERAFVRYTKSGKIVPGSLIVTQGTFPKSYSVFYEIPMDLCCQDMPPVGHTIVNNRAFVRYTKEGKIVPGSLIITNKGKFPKGPGVWKEVPTDLCCKLISGCGAPYFINLLETGTNPAIEYPGTSCVDSDCNMVVGYTIGTTYPDPNTQLHQAVIIKYDKNGNTLWQKVQNIEKPWDVPIIGSWSVSISGINVDSNNDIYVCDTFSIYKLSGVDGSLIWLKSLYYTNLIPPPFSFLSIQNNISIYINTNDELYLCFNSNTDTIISPTTTCTGTTIVKKSTLVKLNPATGDSLIEKTIDIPSSIDGIVLFNYAPCFTPLTGDSNGNIFVSIYYGFVIETSPGSGVCDNYGLNNTIKFDNNLNYISNFQYNIDPGFNVFPVVNNSVYTDFYNLNLDKNNNFYFNGWGNSNGPDPILFYRSKVDSSYNLQWCKKIEYTGLLAFLDFSQNAVDSDGNSYILATDYDSIGHLIKINSNGNLVWATQIVSSVGDTELYNNLWYLNANQLSITKDTITMILGTIDYGIVAGKALFIKYPNDTQILGTYGTTTFTDVTSQYTVSSLTPLIKSIPIIVTPTNYYTPNLTPYTYSVTSYPDYTVLKTNI